MAGYERMAKRLNALQGKRISEESLRRELDKAVPGARWDVERTGRGLVLFSETDGVYVTVTLSCLYGNRNNYVIDRVSVSATVWQQH